MNLAELGRVGGGGEGPGESKTPVGREREGKKKNRGS